MSTKPAEEVLTRKLSDEAIALAQSFSTVLQEVVNYGTTVIRDCSRVKPLEPFDVVPISLLYHALEMIDGISILALDFSTEPSSVLLRSLLETAVGAIYMLEGDTQKRAYSYIVANKYNSIDILKKFRQGGDFLKLIDEEGLSSESFKSKSRAIEEAIEEEENKLKGDLLKPYAVEYLRNKKLNRRNWYSLYKGPKDFSELSKAVKLGSLYMRYKQLSQKIHAADVYSRRIAESDEIISFIQMRYGNQLQEIIMLSITLTCKMIGKFVKYYTPERLDNHNDWYRNEIHPSQLILISKPLIQYS